MAFRPNNFKSKNPTGDKAFNGITRIVHGAPDAADQAEDTDAPPVAPAAPSPAPGKKPQPKRMGGSKKYDTATHSFRNC